MTMTNHFQYGFYDRLSSEFPSQIIVDISEVCNLACIHCPHPQFKESELYNGQRLDIDLHHKMVHEVRDHGQGQTQYIRYTSEGEPLTHPKVFEMLTYSKENSGTTVTLTTNGTLLNKAKIEKLLATNIDIVDISLDAFKDETYSKIRVNGKLPTTRQNVLNLIERIKETQSHMKVVLSFVEQEHNKDEVDDFKNFWEDAGAHYVVIRKLHSSAGAVSDIASDLNEKYHDEDRRPCLYPWERITLTPRGMLIFCPSDWVHGSDIEYYQFTTIKELWDGKFYKALREAHLTNNYCNHKFCGRCPDWAGTSWPGQGRSYANMVEEFKETE